ncbi:hypothetical protein TrCOL_g11309 [Triparma columacea]|uniref:Uncharacterized protein n=1 Tax=Triparma columacea TaxID=722753 RepID=A0A9W7FYT6_9STRA|nr:hypothetical protein TrCOL_g11309 [Triparma columacea]
MLRILLPFLFATTATSFGIPKVTKLVSHPRSYFVSPLYMAGIDGGGLNIVEGEISTLDAATMGPKPVAVRNSGSTVLVCGLLKTKERTDQTTFDFLKDSPSFSFSKIVAYCNDAAFAKKRLTSRSARYSGLLDILTFQEATKPDCMPSKDDLSGVDSVIAYGVEASEVKDLAKSMSEAKVGNAVVVMEKPESAKKVKDAVSALSKAGGVSFTVITMPTIVDGAEGSSPYRVGEATDVESFADCTIPRDEALRLITECLGLESSVGKAISFRGVSTENKSYEYLKSLRSKGYTRSQEVENMIMGGVEKYEAALVEKEQKEEEVAKVQEVKKVEISKSREQEIKDLMAKAKAESAEFERKQIENDAREILAREWREQYFARNTSLKEDDYIEENMERGMQDALRMIKMMRGESTSDMDDDDELRDWEKEQIAEAEEAEKKLAAVASSDSSPDEETE